VQRPEEELITLVKRAGVDFTASLPCDKVKTLIDVLTRSLPHIPLTREEEGVGICAGAALSGRRPAMFVQSSGIGNMINALLSLTQFYELPLALFVSRRGFYQEKIEAQFPMGQKLPGILSGAGIGWTEINSAADLKKVEQELPGVYTGNRIHAFLISPALWEGSDCEMQGAPCRTQDRLSPAALHDSRSTHPASRPTLTRYDILQSIAPYLEGRMVVSNLGCPSKELCAVRHQASNFYMLGSMGMATPIGLGIALTSSKEVIVIDGDGSLLMNPGTLATAAALAPKNLTIVAIDNGAYGSTGNQPTLAGSCVDLELVAQGFGFRNTIKTASEAAIVDVMKNPREGLTFIHMLAVPGNRDMSAVSIDHRENKRYVQEFLKR
jgi:sulfopyruvate decarboxylase beta subunit